MSASELPLPMAGPAPSAEDPPARADTRLRLLGLTPDREHLLLRGPDGGEFTVPVDARMRAAMSGDPARPARPAASDTPEETMETMLRPRDIQARIRAGATPESVAEAAGCTVEKVMTYAAPVLAEREHIAQRALRASLRRPSGEQHALGRTLGEAVSARLRAMNVDPDSVLWDAWRREDGRWALTAAFSAGGYDGLAEFSFDQRGNFITTDNDEARWLIGDLAAPSAETDGPAEEPIAAATLTAVPNPIEQPEPTELGTDAIELVTEPVTEPEPVSAADDELDATLDQPLIDESLLDLPPLGASRASEPDAVAEPEAEPDSEPEPEPVGSSSRKRRVSVPSWDEILFGGGDQPS